MAYVAPAPVTRSYVIPVAEFNSAELAAILADTFTTVRTVEAYAGLVEFEATSPSALLHEAFGDAVDELAAA